MSRDARFEVRSRILRDCGISDGAARLFLLLDDKAMGREQIPPAAAKESMRELDIKERELRNRLTELRLAFYLRVKRTGRLNEYEFVRKIPAQTCRSDRQRFTEQIGTNVPVASLLINTQEVLQEPPTPFEQENQNQPEDFPAFVPDPSICVFCHGRKYCGSGLDRSPCAECRGTGKRSDLARSCAQAS